MSILSQMRRISELIEKSFQGQSNYYREDFNFKYVLSSETIEHMT